MKFLKIYDSYYLAELFGWYVEEDNCEMLLKRFYFLDNLEK